METLIQFENVTKQYRATGGKVCNALSNLTLSIRKGELLTIVGPSGAGKTTVLNLIGGIENPTSGELKFQGSVTQLATGYVFQTNTIFPWRTVERNLTYPLELGGVARNLRQETAVQLCEMIGLSPETFLSKYPKELSGGESRRVAIGMALAREASLLLLDEPTSQLDYLTKWSIQNTIQRLWMQKRFTVVLVTHDLEEAIFLGDRVLGLRAGVIAGEVRIDLPRPRNDHMRNTKEFGTYREQIVAGNNRS